MGKAARAVERRLAEGDAPPLPEGSIAATVAQEHRHDVMVTENGDAIYVPGAESVSGGNGAEAPPRKRKASGAYKYESKADRFRRLANRRVPRALKDLIHVQRLANRSQYEYTEGQAQRIVEALQAALANVRTAFAGTKQRDALFTL